MGGGNPRAKPSENGTGEPTTRTGNAVNLWT